MEFRIADTFTDSLARLTGEEQKAVKTTAFDLQMDPTAPGMQFHRIDRAKDPNFWSVRVSSDIRLIVHKTAAYGQEAHGPWTAAILAARRISFIPGGRDARAPGPGPSRTHSWRTAH